MRILITHSKKNIWEYTANLNITWHYCTYGIQHEVNVLYGDRCRGCGEEVPTMIMLAEKLRVDVI
jgi:hypothetical protein